MSAAQEEPGRREQQQHEDGRDGERQGDAAVDDEQADQRRDDDRETDAGLHEALRLAPVGGGDVVGDQGLRDALERVGHGREADDAEHEQRKAVRPGDQGEGHRGQGGSGQDDRPTALAVASATVGQESHPGLDQDPEDVVHTHDQPDEAAWRRCTAAARRGPARRRSSTPIPGRRRPGSPTGRCRLLICRGAVDSPWEGPSTGAEMLGMAAPLPYAIARTGCSASDAICYSFEGGGRVTPSGDFQFEKRAVSREELDDRLCAFISSSARLPSPAAMAS